MKLRITDLLAQEAIELNGAPANKNEAIEQMIELMATSGKVTNIAEYTAAVLKRETEGSTGIGEGVAIPHAKSNAVSSPGLAAMVVKSGVNFDSLDGEPAYLIFLIASPNTEENVHLEVLARLSVLLLDDAFRNSLMHAENTAHFMTIINEAETARFATEDAKASATHAPASNLPQILAVTACPTGIAHTYMAAEALEKAAAKMGVSIKVETDGSGGIKNKLTAAEIAAAKGIIIAADKDVEMARFNGKPVLSTKVADGIHKPQALIEDIQAGKAPEYHHTGAEGGDSFGAEDSFGRKMYKALMNGVSYMLPFVIGGGILLALSFLFDGANAGNANFGSGNSLSLFLNTIGGLSFGLMFPILAGFIAMAIGERPAFMVGMVGGLIAKSGVSMSLPQEEWISSGFFGALLAGFIAGFLMLALRRIFSVLPKALEGTKPTLLYPFFGILLISAIMVFIVNPPVSWFNTWLYTQLDNMGESSRVLLGIVLGGMMSIDFGGPINKAAYVFGTASIATGQTDIMAAVMAGGMVPPLAIALSTLFFKNRYTKAERGTTVTNFVMGASFITEGAIPFAATDPLRVIPSCAIGAATAGGLSMLFGCGSPAPHGGLFVIPVITNWPMYLVAIAAGAVVGMLMLALLKKPLPGTAAPPVKKP